MVGHEGMTGLGVVLAMVLRNGVKSLQNAVSEALSKMRASVSAVMPMPLSSITRVRVSECVVKTIDNSFNRRMILAKCTRSLTVKVIKSMISDIRSRGEPAAANDGKS